MNKDLLSFASSVGVMKPAKIKKDNAKEATKLEKLLDSPEYVLDHKYDGCRYKWIGPYAFSSEHVEKTDNFPHIRDFLARLGMPNLILDGEIYYPGKTSQQCVPVTGASPATAVQYQENNGFICFVIYDILRTPKGSWLHKNTYDERRRILEYFYATYIKHSELAPYIHLSEIHRANKREVLSGWLESGLEGGILKKIDSVYHMGKKPMWQWMKIKQEDDADLIIMGFEPASVDYVGDNLEGHPYWLEINGAHRPVTKYHYLGWIGSVVFGGYVNGVLVRLCTASGMSEDIRKDMTENPDKYLNKVARVTFMEKTADGYPRHPNFKNLHEGKLPEECTWEF